MLQLSDALKLDRPNLLGWSSGGNVGLVLAALHGGRIGRVASLAGMAGGKNTVVPPTYELLNPHRQVSLPQVMGLIFPPDNPGERASELGNVWRWRVAGGGWGGRSRPQLPPLLLPSVHPSVRPPTAALDAPPPHLATQFTCRLQGGDRRLHQVCVLDARRHHRPERGRQDRRGAVGRRRRVHPPRRARVGRAAGCDDPGELARAPTPALERSAGGGATSAQRPAVCVSVAPSCSCSSFASSSGIGVQA